MTDDASRPHERQPSEAVDPDAIPGLDTPYDDEHLQALLDRIQGVMAKHRPRREKLGELGSSVKPGEWVDLVRYLTRDRPRQP